jgi:hypothetical protein
MTYCEACWWQQQPCPKSPTLRKDTAILYAYTGTLAAPADLEIVSVEDCGETIVVEGQATTGCQLALDRAWDAVLVPAFDKPIEFRISGINDLPPECKPE